MTNHPVLTDVPANLTEGQKVAGCYVLKSRVADSPGFQVWRAEDEVLGKDVTLHFLPVAVAGNRGLMGALRQEIKRARALIHPRILRVYDLVEEVDWAAISMDTFEGRTLASLLKEKGVFTPAEIIPWLGQLCQTLEEAHKINLTHRDLAPENVIITGNNDVLLANFGISRVVRDALNGTSNDEPARFWTASPQLLDGETPTAADDVYGVGALLFELLTGAPVFEGKDVAKHVRATVPPLASGARLARHPEADAIPAEWNEMIAATLAKKPESRPPSIGEISVRLSAVKVAPNEPQNPTASPVVTSSALPKKKPAEILAERAAQFKTENGTPESERTSRAKKNQVEVPVETLPAAISPAPSSPADKETNPKRKAADILAERAAQFRAENDGGGIPPTQQKSAKTKSEKPKASLSDSGTGLLLPAERKRSPGGALAFIALLILGAAGYLYYQNSMEDPASPPSQIAMTEPREGEELTSVTNPAPTRAPTDEPPAPTEKVISAPPSVSSAPEKPQAAKIAETPAPAERRMEMPAELSVTPPAASALSQEPVVVVAQNTGTRRAATPAPAVAIANSDELAEKAAALEKLRQDEATLESAHQAKVKQQQAAEAAAIAAQKAVAEKTKMSAPSRKAVEELLAARKKREEEQRNAEAAAQAAQQLAADKARASEEAKKALAEFDAQNTEKLAAQRQVETEIQSLQQTLADRQKAAASAAREAAEVESSRQQQTAAIKRTEQELAQARAAAERAAAESEKKRLAMEAERRRLDDELAAMRIMFETKMKELEDRRRHLEGIPATPPAAAPTGNERSNVPPPAPPKAAATPTVTVAMVAPVEKTTTPDSQPPVDTAPGENSLGLKFAPVGDVFFSIWETRVKDFETFAKEVNLKTSKWRAPGFRQGPDHPVVNVTWNEAIAFCKWLTEKERKEGRLPASQIYRLPTDLEWSAAVGLPPESGKTPEARDMGVPDVYPWGTDWPPPEGAGNYTGEETGSDVAIKGYNDKFQWTAPVGTFPPNKFGLYDMGGNVWQWCMDSWNNESKAKVLRGASWYNGALKLSLLASCRVQAAPDSSTDNYGFRIVRASDSGTRPGRR